MYFTKTRIAPTPSGFLHLGNVLSFAVTAYLARTSGARLLLRIDDLDRERTQPEYVQDIFDTLRFLEIPWEEGPADLSIFETKFSQLHRLHLYNDALDELRRSNAVFACTCSRSQLASDAVNGAYPGTCRDKQIPLDQPGVAWRLKTDERVLSVQTIDGNTIQQPLPSVMKDFIVRKKDGFPAYQLTSMIDDLYWKIDLIVRGADLWDSTLAQLYLAGLMRKPEFELTRFYHHVLLSSADGIKFSKSAGDTSIRFLRNEGRRPAAIFTMIAGMMNRKETVNDWYSLGDLVYHSAMFLR
ncbi:MAG: tRNA glutamyl-Q synthetase [Citrobacter freundii]|nr:MAG: tRNA glutamyl-Q synthetase [Citrobacter freundii]